MRALKRRERALLVAAAVVAVLAGMGSVVVPGRLVLYNRTPSVQVSWYYLRAAETVPPADQWDL